MTAEDRRLQAARERTENWKRWGPYLSERQWGTVREDYSEHGNCWDYFPHDHARSRAYRWGEDGLLGICDRECRLCFSVALWNGRDPILKERLFGLTGPEGNHGEDVKECYYYLDSSPTHSYMKALYKYPQAEFPYARLVDEARRRGKHDPEFELLDSGVFDGNRYFDVVAEYAKAAPDDLLIRITVTNHGPETATLHLLPTLWFRNSWSWGCDHDGCEMKPNLHWNDDYSVACQHPTLGAFEWQVDRGPDGQAPTLLFTENETNFERIYGMPSPGQYVKDAFHNYVIHGQHDAVNPRGFGTKAAAQYVLTLAPGARETVRLRLFGKSESRREGEAPAEPRSMLDSLSHGGSAGASPSRSLPACPSFGPDFDAIFATRIAETDAFYATRYRNAECPEQRLVARQAYAGLLWSKQFYHYAVKSWIDGDPSQPSPPAARKHGRNRDWQHLFNRDVISMPDKWEYPWYAAWDLAFHMLPFARIDADFAKEQLVLMLREWYMHPNGQIPAYEFAFGDVNPPVHAWACWRVYKMTAPKGQRDRVFLARVFNKLLINFTWWVNRKDVEGNHLFSGGFLGLDNIGVFDRSKPLPTGGHLEQADGTAWMAFYCATMLAMALELAAGDPAYEDIASKFFEHFVAIADAMNCLGGSGLWDEEDGFYYDKLHADGFTVPLRIRSMVGIIPLFTAEVLEQDVIDKLPDFKKRMEWFLHHRKDLARHISIMQPDSWSTFSTCSASNRSGHVGNVPHDSASGQHHLLLAIPSKERLLKVLKYVLDENEFLSPYGIRALSRVHKDRPYVFHAGGEEHRVEYVPAESTSGLFGGNSNWRGPIWFPVNYLLIEVLERYHYFYGDSLTVEYPTGSGRLMNLKEIAHDLSERMTRLFLPDENGRRPCHGDESRYAHDPAWRELVLFYEYFHGDNGRGVGASHQTGWTALVAKLLEK